MTLEIGYFDAGWAFLTWKIGGLTFRIDASYVYDGISEMAKVAVLLLKGSTSLHFTFQEEPGEYVFMLERTHSDLLKVTVYENQNCFSHKNETQLISVECPVLDFVGPVFSALHTLKVIKDPGYKERWRHGFPTEEYEFLKAKL